MITIRGALLLLCLAAPGGAMAQDLRDKCASEDIKTDWMMTLARSSQPEECLVRVNNNGKIDGECSRSGSRADAPLGGSIGVNEFCLVTGDLVIGEAGGQERLPIFMSMSRDKTVLHGIVGRRGDFVPATGIRLFIENLL